MTQPDWEQKLLGIINHQAQDLDNTEKGLGKAQLKGEIHGITLRLDSGEIEIPVDNLLPGSLGVAVNIAAGCDIIASGARMTDLGKELADAVPNESSFPSDARGDWFTNSPAAIVPAIHSGVGFYNDTGLNARGIAALPVALPTPE